MVQYWLPHEEQAWVLGALSKENDEDVVFQIEGGREGELLTLPKSKLESFAIVLPGQADGVEDVCTLSCVSEAVLLHTVRVRYKQQMVYTRLMRTLVALNPFADLPIYSSQYIDQYMAARDAMDLPPHIFGVGQDALRALQTGARDQAVLISGESGAGKTESAKLIMSFVAEAVKGGSEDGSGMSTTEAVLQTNPVLEAFGNAMTVRNNNSSRFGKWLDLRISSDSRLDLRGCTLSSYLLETTRVCTQAWNERGYHVFFQVLQAREDPAFKELELGGHKEYAYLKEGQLVAPGVNDAADFRRLREALSALGIDAAAQLEVFRVVAGILNVGNCDFVPNEDASNLVDEKPAKQAAKLLGLDEERLKTCVLYRKIMIARDVTTTPLRVEQARAARDGLARLLYGRLFLGLIEIMNRRLSPADAGANACLLGVLDIAGFENFQKNSLEQLMINLSNEHLQQHFNQVIIKEELEEFTREGLKLPDISKVFADNADCLDLIDGKGAILDLLDETMTVPKPVDQLFVTKVLEQRKDHKRLIAGKVKKCGFGIRHFAGSVEYTCDGWLDKNADRPPDDAAAMMAASSLKVLKEIGEAVLAEAGGNDGGSNRTPRGPPAPRGAARKAKSVSSGFRTSLRSLMEKVTKAQPHYIRCIKPNVEKEPGRFTGHMVMEQLLLSGVLATVRLREQGYSYRLTHQEFLGKYRNAILAQLSGPKSMFDGFKRIQELERIVELLPDLPPSRRQGSLSPSVAFARGNIVVGTSKLFMKPDAFKALERIRADDLATVAALVQRIYRGFVGRRRARRIRDILEGLRATVVALRIELPSAARDALNMTRRQSAQATAQAVWGGGSLLARLASPGDSSDIMIRLEPLLAQGNVLNIIDHPAVAISSLVLERLRQELGALAEAEAVATSVDAVAIEKVVAKARGFDMVEDGGKFPFAGLESRMKKLKTQLPLVRAMKTALQEASNPKGAEASKENGVDDDDEEEDPLQELLQALDDMELARGSKKWLPELEGAALADKLYALAEQRQAEAEQRKKEAEEQAAAEARAKQEAAAAAAAAAAASAFFKAEDQDESAPAVGRKSTTRSNRSGPGSRGVSFSLPGEREDIIGALKRAIDLYDLNALEENLREATDCGLDEESGGETLQRAQRLLEKMQQHVKLVQVFEALVSEAELDTPSIQDLRRVENVAKQLQKMPGLSAQVTHARKALQQGLARRPLKQGRSTVFKSMDVEELELAKRIFAHIDLYWRMKPVKQWAGHRQSVAVPGMRRQTIRRLSTGTMGSPVSTLGGYSPASTAPQSTLPGYSPASRAPVSAMSIMSAAPMSTMSAAPTSAMSAFPGGGMLLHSKVCIAEALTRVPEGVREEDFEEAAVQNFRNLLVCMGESVAQQVQRQASQSAVLSLATSNVHMREEIFAQVLKQLAQNPSSESSQVGWKLLLELCQQALPSPDMAEFVRSFVHLHGDQKAGSIAQACLSALERDAAGGGAGGAMPQQAAAGGGGSSGNEAHLVAENARLHAELWKLRQQLVEQAVEIQMLRKQLDGQITSASEVAEIADRGMPPLPQAEPAKEKRRLAKAVRKVLFACSASAAMKSSVRANAKFTAEAAVGHTEAIAAEEEEYAALMSKWDGRRGRTTSVGALGDEAAKPEAGAEQDGAESTGAMQKMPSQGRRSSHAEKRVSFSEPLGDVLRKASVMEDAGDNRPRLESSQSTATERKRSSLGGSRKRLSALPTDLQELRDVVGSASAEGGGSGQHVDAMQLQELLGHPGLKAELQRRCLKDTGKTADLAGRLAAKLEEEIAAAAPAPASAAEAPPAPKGKGKGPPPPAPAAAVVESTPTAVATEAAATTTETPSPEPGGKAAKGPPPVSPAKAGGKGPAPPPSPDKGGGKEPPAPTASGKGPAKGPPAPGGGGKGPPAPAAGEAAAAPTASGKGPAKGPPAPAGGGKGPPAPTAGKAATGAATEANSAADTTAAAPEAPAAGAGKGKAGKGPPPPASSSLSPPAGDAPAKGAGKGLAPPARQASPAPGGALASPRSPPGGSPLPSPRGGAGPPLAVVAVGAGGVDDLREKLDDGAVMWALMRLQVGSGHMMRTKFVFIHHNGDDVSTVKRGRLNARTKEAQTLLGNVHASLEVKRKEELTLDVLCEKVVSVFIADDGRSNGSSSSGSLAANLKKEFEELARKAAEAAKPASGPMPAGIRTANEMPGKKFDSHTALRAVSQAHGAFNWMLMEPDNLGLHNAGYGGLDEMKDWLKDDMVLFGVIRFSFGEVVKHVFVHWVGPSLSAVKRGRWNAKCGGAENLGHKSVILTMRREAHCKEDLEVAELVSEIRRLSVVDAGGNASSAAQEQGAISVDEYLQTLELEKEAQLRQAEAEAAAAGLATQEGEGEQPEIRKAVDTVRGASGEWNWLLIAPGA
eukprot:TRINITY_DN59213_c0_g4_i1.p1 TRINITY_DN59213_c0_g4~~TRINITY_DN59213_c0_g4_i1.p1  ORF type:complete len:2408 (-),score=722.48 TRINITY_DN59213_c0_g4_i1:73-7296(-)